MEPDSTQAEERAQVRPRSRGARVVRGLLWTVASLIVLVVVLVAAGWWWLGSNQSLAFALAQAARYLPAGQTLESRDVTGSLRAGGHIAWLRWQGPTLAVEVHDARIGWHLPPLIDRKVELGEVHAAQILIEPRGDQTKKDPTQPLEQLTLPVEIDLPFRVDDLRWAGPPALAATGLAGHYRYKDAHHLLDIDSVDIADGHYSAKVKLQGPAPMALDLSLDGKVRAPLDKERHIDVVAKASASGTLFGPDARLKVNAELAPAEPGDGAPMQARVAATIAPWQAQPVIEADADLRNVDASMLWPQAPRTLLTGTVKAGPAPGASPGTTGWKGSVDVANAAFGPWDQGKVPVEAIRAGVEFDGSTWTVTQGDIQVGGGHVDAEGSWSPAPEPWKLLANLRGIRPAALHTAMAGGTVNGRITASQDGEPIVFDVQLQAQGGAGAADKRDTIEGLRIDRVLARGQWRDQVLDLRTLSIEADRAKLEGTLQARVAEQAATAKLDLSLPGGSVQLQGNMAPAKGNGTLNAKIADAAALQRWVEGLPGLGAAFAGNALQGNAQLDASWNGGWQELQRRFAEVNTPARGAEPTFQATLSVPNLEVRSVGKAPAGTKVQGAAAPKTAAAAATAASATAPAAATATAASTATTPTEPIRLRGLRAELSGSLAQAKLMVQGDALMGDRRVTLDLNGGGGLERTNQWRTQIATLRTQLHDEARKNRAPWVFELKAPLNTTTRTAANGALQVEGSGGSATITGPVPGTVRLDWEPMRFSQSGPAAKRAYRLQSKGRMQGLPLAWAEALSAAGLSDVGVTGDLSFNGDWDIEAGDVLRAHARLARASGDIRVQAGEAAMVRRLKSTGTGTASEITLDSGSTKREVGTPAGLRQAELNLDAQGDTVRATLAWDSERGGQVNADASTRVVQNAGGWRWADDAPLAGSIKARLPNLGVWSILAPPGWRIGGTLDADATLSGTRSAPRWNGKLAADQLALRAAVEGLDLRDGKLRATLSGDRLTVDEFSLKGGPGSNVRIAGQSGNISTRASEAAADGGTLKVTGEASWSQMPADPAQKRTGIRMAMQGEVRSLRVLVRSDRQVTLSGDLQARLESGQLTVRGKLKTDRGVIILPDETAPSLGSDVVVHSAAKDREAAEAAAKLAQRSEEEIAQARTAKPADIQITLDLGDDFAVQGRGITTRLEGELAIRSAGAGSPPRIVGEVRTVKGQYRAYGQQLDVETGIARFTGEYDNPQLDILALRPNIAQRAGVQISGTAHTPRVKLYSEPQLSDAETLSWVVLGRASAANGGEAILMQQAALALLGKIGAGSNSGNLASRFGLDEIGFKGPSTGGDLNESAVTLGKRLSKDFYVTYERSLAGTVGTLYIFYDLTQRLTLRGQGGEQYGADLIYTVKFD